MTVRLGYMIQFTRHLPRFSGVLFTSVAGKDCGIAVLLVKDAVEPVSPAKMKTGFYSPYFIKP